MAKLFSDKLNNLQKELEDLRTQFRDASSYRPITINKELIAPVNQRLTEIEHRLSDCETKINELIEQITPILLSHADALKQILRMTQKLQT